MTMEPGCQEYPGTEVRIPWDVRPRIPWGGSKNTLGCPTSQVFLYMFFLWYVCIHSVECA
jgi:hypothetical protein